MSGIEKVKSFLVENKKLVVRLLPRFWRCCLSEAYFSLFSWEANSA